MAPSTFDFTIIKETHDRLVQSLKNWQSPIDGFYRSTPVNLALHTPSFTNTGMVLQAFNESKNTAYAQSLADNLLSYLDTRQNAPFPQEKVEGVEKPHVMNNSWIAFGLLDCYPSELQKLSRICEWFLESQRNDFGWNLIPDEQTAYPAIDAYALRTIVKYYRTCKLMGLNDQALYRRLEMAILNGVHGLEARRGSLAKQNHLYLWPASLGDASKDRISFGTSTLCMHVIAKAAQALDQEEWSRNVVNTFGELSNAFKHRNQGQLNILDYEVAIWDTIAINESSLNYTWSFFAPISLTTLLMYIEDLKDKPGYYDIIEYFTSWMLNNTQSVLNGVGVRGGENTQGVKIWSTAESVIALSRILSHSYEISQLNERSKISTERLVAVIDSFKQSPTKRRSLTVLVMAVVVMIAAMIWLALFKYVLDNWGIIEPVSWVTGIIFAIVCFLFGVDFKGIRESILGHIMEIVYSRQILNTIKELIEQERQNR